VFAGGADTAGATGGGKKSWLAPVFRDGLDYPKCGNTGGQLSNGEVSDKHKVTITRSFAVGKYPVTVEEWRRYVDAKSVVTKEPMSVYFGAPGMAVK